MLYICSDRTRHASRWPAKQGWTFLIKGNHCNIQMRYEEFEDAFSSDRMSKYVTACNGDTRRSKKQKYIVKYLQDLDIMPKFAAFIPGSLWISSCRVFLFIAIWWKITSNVCWSVCSPCHHGRPSILPSSQPHVSNSKISFTAVHGTGLTGLVQCSEDSLQCYFGS